MLPGRSRLEVTVAGEQVDYSPKPKRGEGKQVPPAPRKRVANGGPGESSEVEDYTPRPSRRSGAGKKARLSRRPAQSEPAEVAGEYTPRPARRSSPEKQPRTAEPAFAQRMAQGSRRGKKGSSFDNKLLWRLVALGGLLILIVPTVLVAVNQDRSSQDPEVAALLARLEQDPNDLEALISLGNHYFEEGVYWWGQEDSRSALSAFESADAYYESALRLAPDLTNVRTDLGTMYYYQGQLRDEPALVERAIQEWQVALSYEPDKPETLFNLGIGYLALDQREQALAVWQRVIEVAPDSSSAQDARQMIEQYGGP